jgi:hypothetical protein
LFLRFSAAVAGIVSPISCVINFIPLNLSSFRLRIANPDGMQKGLPQGPAVRNDLALVDCSYCARSRMEM